MKTKTERTLLTAIFPTEIAIKIKEKAKQDRRSISQTVYFLIENGLNFGTKQKNKGSSKIIDETERTNLTTSLPTEFAAKIKAKAKNDRRSVSQTICFLVEDGLE